MIKTSEKFEKQMVLLRARRDENEMKMKPATNFKIINTIYSQKKKRKKKRQDSKQKNVSKQYLSSLCHKVLQK